MAKGELQTQYIHLVDENGGRTVRAWNGFTWQPYPQRIEYYGRTWEYFFCADAVPHYRAVGMATKPARFLLEHPRRAAIEPGMSLQFRLGPFKVVKVCPEYPSGILAGEYRRAIYIEDPDGKSYRVVDAFIAQWMTRWSGEL